MSPIDTLTPLIKSPDQTIFARNLYPDEMAAALERVSQNHQHFVVLERLGHVVERAALHRGDRVLDRGKRGHHDDGQLFVQLFERLEGLHAVQARQHHVDDRRVEGIVAGKLYALLAARGKTHGVPLGLEERLENLAHDFFVVNDED